MSKIAIKVDKKGIKFPALSKALLTEQTMITINKVLTDMGIGMRRGWVKSWGVELQETGYRIMYFGNDERDLPTDQWLIKPNEKVQVLFKTVGFDLSKDLKIIKDSNDERSNTSKTKRLSKQPGAPWS